MQFWLLAGLMSLVAMLFVLWPLIGGRSEARAARIRSHSNLAIFEDRLAELEAEHRAGSLGDEDFAVLRKELERSLLNDIGDTELSAGVRPRHTGGRLLLWGGALALPLLALTLYSDWGLALGAHEDWRIAEDFAALEAAPEAVDPAQLAPAADRLARRLEQQPDDTDGWFLLGRSALSLGQYERAADAFAEVTKRAPDAIGALVYQAQARYLADGRQLSARTRALVEQGLEQAPSQPILLELLAMDALQAGRHVEAARRFRDLLIHAEPEGERRQFLLNGLAQALRAGDLSVDDLPTPDGAPQSGGTGVEVQVELPAQLLEALPDSARVFVLARPLSGSRMPLAVKRLRPAPELQVTLTPADAMAPGQGLGQHDTVEVVVRISRSGSVEGTEPDWERSVKPVPTVGGDPVVVDWQQE